MTATVPSSQAAQMIEVNRMTVQDLDTWKTTRHLELHLRHRQTRQASDGVMTDDEQLSDKVQLAAAYSANGPDRIMPVTATNRCEHDRDAATLIDSGSDGFRGVQFRPARLAKRQTAAWRGLSGEVVRIVSQDSFESDYHGPCHLLVLYTQASRHRG